MDDICKIFKFKINGEPISVTLDSSYLANKAFKNTISETSINIIHYHALYELFIIGDSEITFFTEDTTQTYKNCILIVPPFVKHYAIRKSNYRIMFSFKSDCTIPSQPFSLKSSEDIYFYCKKIEEALLKTGSYNDEITECFLKLIFCEIAALNKNKKTEDYKPKEESFFEIIENILLNFGSDITLGDVAAQLNLGKKQTTRIIRKNYNSTFAEMLRERRLNAALYLLANTDKSISEIVENINFSSESYFYSKFKENYGVTPLEYRAKNRNKNGDV